MKINYPRGSYFALFLFFLLSLNFSFSQTTYTQKAENILHERDELVFTFYANSMHEVRRVSRILSFDHGHDPRTPLTINAIAHNTPFDFFLSFTLQYTIYDC